MVNARRIRQAAPSQKSTLAASAIDFIGELYEIEWEVKALHDRRIAQRSPIHDGTATAEAFDYSLKQCWRSSAT